ncbi:MAG TPA: GPR1/FUN34/YaaH family transporter [Acidimicrobiales bacterium]|nr:GPR1/FUN34/YaaH family transporter [Acidimicrobiales bacterium]
MTMAGRVNEGRTAAGTHSAETDRALVDLATSEADEAWLSRTRIFLQPIAAPSVMGLFGFAVATMMVGAWQAGWYGDSSTPLILWPFTLVAGGLLQIIAAVACFKARDSIALGVHAIWGAFWLAWSTLQILVALHVMAPLPLGSANGGFGFWFIGLALVTMSGFFASLAQSGLLAITLGTLSAGSALTAAGFWAGSLGTTRAGGWLFVISAAAAWLFATAMQLEGSFGRTIIPLGKLNAASNIPGRSATRPIERAAGMPGVRVGQ